MGESEFQFKQTTNLESRQAESARILEKYPDRVPVIVKRADKSSIPDIDKKKFLVPVDLAVGQFVFVIRKRMKLTPEKAIFVFVKDVLPPTSAMMAQIYDESLRCDTRPCEDEDEEEEEDDDDAEKGRGRASPARLPTENGAAADGNS
ncbi:hypothetical protein AXG93_1299s1290 [Marchantia polymorpha subsp. ruderalis]|uniref:Autophagy-related protein n=1 Tax=Marchantia polymorpha subsp. ruderalis TaxID=1480154 RepID=A0A176WNT0_MARPO|nr:hypothetical protein AXG93_1299s1290 [Marchantia polymorpha subsp. ruderalis]